MTNKLITLTLFSLFFIAAANGQGLMCESSEPFCTGTIYNFPAGTTGTAQPGANYGCLATQPAPAWYHMLIEDPGNITIYMYSTPLVDIDFICWGPFADPYSPCVTGLTANTIVDCSYSPNPTEYCDIPNGQTGQYYILLITNYSQQPCNITFSQTAGTGSTDCTILPPPVSNNGPLCVGETLNLYAETIVNASYYWSGPNGFLSVQQNPVIPNVTLANAGDYSCTITVNGQSSDPAITSVIIYNNPTATLLSSDTTICIGTAALAKFNLVGWGPFVIQYNDGTNTFNSPNLYGPVDTIFLTPTVSTTYTFTKVTDLHCERTILFSDMQVNTYPFTSGALTGSGSICAGEPAQLVFSLTGTSPWDITYTANGADPQTVTANSSPHVVTVYPYVPTLYEFAALEDVHCDGTTSGEALIEVDPSPTAGAGTDQTIPYGTSTVLQGQASGGSGNYSYSWVPVNKLVNAGVAQPTTINLTETTLFTLTVTDNNGGCQGIDETWVTITGGPLVCAPYATPDEICNNLTTQLYATAGGGSGNYTYTWSSSPAGFSSTLNNPVVSPGVTTVYSVSVSDGYNVVNGNVTVTVNQRPSPDAGANQVILHGTSTQLAGSGTGGSGNYSYQWEPANKLVDPSVPNPQTVNLYATTLFTLTVTDASSGCASESPAEMTVVISGDALSASPTAEPDEICQGLVTTLHALAGGGSGQYTYTWSSTPMGFVSHDPDPQVAPTETTFYTVEVDDGFNTAYGYVNVTVLDAPEINLGPQNITACVYDTITLDAGNPGADYLWSNGSTDRTIDVATTGIGFDLQTHTVTVTSPSGCQGQDSITIVFDFSLCNSIGEGPDHELVRIYPNPGNGKMHLVFEDCTGSAVVSVSNPMGQQIIGPAPLNCQESGFEAFLDISGMPEGLYFVRVSMDDRQPGIFKYILRR
jgi:hypothetical protein